MKTLGTIFATPAQLDAADSRADRMRLAALAVAATELQGMTRRVVGGEVRYYMSPTVYTTAIRRRWFEVRADGDYPISSPIYK